MMLAGDRMLASARPYWIQAFDRNTCRAGGVIPAILNCYGSLPGLPPSSPTITIRVMSGAVSASLTSTLRL